MHLDSFIIRHLETNRAYVVKDVIDRSMINVQSNVNLKTNFHVFRVFVKQMKVDIKRIVKRRNAHVAS